MKTVSQSLEAFFKKRDSGNKQNIKQMINAQKFLIMKQEKNLISNDLKYFQKIRLRDEESINCLTSLVSINSIVNISNEERYKIEKQIEKLKKASEENLKRKLQSFKQNQAEIESQLKASKDRYDNYCHKLDALNEKDPKHMAEVNDFLKYKECLQMIEQNKILKEEYSQLKQSVDSKAIYIDDSEN